MYHKFLNLYYLYRRTYYVMFVICHISFIGLEIVEDLGRKDQLRALSNAGCDLAFEIINSTIIRIFYLLHVACRRAVPVSVARVPFTY